VLQEARGAVRRALAAPALPAMSTESAKGSEVRPALQAATIASAWIETITGRHALPQTAATQVVAATAATPFARCSVVRGPVVTAPQVVIMLAVGLAEMLLGSRVGLAANARLAHLSARQRAVVERKTPKMEPFQPLSLGKRSARLAPFGTSTGSHERSKSQNGALLTSVLWLRNLESVASNIRDVQ
jgi:hypothetical protein